MIEEINEDVLFTELDKKQDVMFMIDPVDELLNQFKQARSGIVTPPQGVIV